MVLIYRLNTLVAILYDTDYPHHIENDCWNHQVHSRYLPQYSSIAVFTLQEIFDTYGSLRYDHACGAQGRLLSKKS